MFSKSTLIIIFSFCLQQVATPSVVKKIVRLKEENSGMFAWEIREQLQQQRICDPNSVPSISSINRILRNSGLWTDEMTSSQHAAGTTSAGSTNASVSGNTSASSGGAGAARYAGSAAAAHAMYSGAAVGAGAELAAAEAHQLRRPMAATATSASSTHAPSLLMPAQFRFAASTPNSAMQARLPTEMPIKPAAKHPTSLMPAAASNTANTAAVSNLSPNAASNFGLQDLSYSAAALPKHWLWNPSLLYYTQHVQAQAAGQFMPYTHAGTTASYYHSSSSAVTKSESSIDLTTPTAGEALSDCDSGKSSPSILINSPSSTACNNAELSCNTKVSPNSRKRNPYSIEELLKKPEKRARYHSESTIKAQDLSESSSSFSFKKEEECSNSSVSSRSCSSNHSSAESLSEEQQHMKKEEEEVVVNVVEECVETVEVVN